VEPGPSAPEPFVRVGLTGGAEPVETVVPTDLPLAEVLPDLLRAAGLLEADLVHLGCRVELLDGRLLRPGSSLRRQGVTDGTVLVLRREERDPTADRYDDLLPHVGRRRLFHRRR
jgi:hypothetical protein